MQTTNIELSIGQISEATSISIDTLRYYEKTGVIPNVKRNSNGRRVYTNHDVKWLQFVNCLKTTGMPLDKIREYLSLMDEGDDTAIARRNILVDYEIELQERINELNFAMQHLQKKIEFYDDYIIKYGIHS